MTDIAHATHLSNSPRLMVTSDKLHPLRISQLEASEQRDSLHAEQPSIDIVAKEKVIRVRAVAADPHKFDQVVELSVGRVSSSCVPTLEPTHGYRRRR